MKKYYVIALAGMFFGQSIQAQYSPMPVPKKPAQGLSSSAPAEVDASEAKPFFARPDQTGKVNDRLIPVDQQIHSPIRWYALENADNPIYWEHVNTERIWLELEIGISTADPEIAAFLTQFELGTSVRRSMHPQLSNFYVFEKPGTTAEDMIAMAQAAKSINGILFLEPSVIYTGNIVPNDPLWNQQWGPYAIYADEAWAGGFTGTNSWNVMAVLDDAVDWFHEDLYDQVWYGYDYGFDDFSPTLDSDEQKHGTHVTGIMAGTSNNGVGMAGMCNDTVYFAKVTDNTYFTQNGAYSDAAIIDAIYDISQIDRVMVINLSLGGGAPSAAAEQAYNFAWNSGKFPIAASGNDGLSTISYPAGYSACMAVGSIGTNGSQLYLTTYSNYGTGQEVTAPGGDMSSGYGIISTVPDNQYEAFEGTSMACPHVAGLAGLMKSINTNLTNSEIRNIINSTCFDLGDTGYDLVFGNGMVNAQLAIQIALQSTSVEETENTVLKMYPNPATDQLWIDNFHGVEHGKIEIYNLAGQMVRNESIQPRNLLPVNVSELPNGVYVVQMNGGNQLFTGRFVKASN